jgi:hypothetical protein
VQIGYQLLCCRQGIRVYRLRSGSGCKSIFVELGVETLSSRPEEAPYVTAQKVVNRYLLTRHQVPIFQDSTFAVAYNCGCFRCCLPYYWQAAHFGRLVSEQAA